MRAGILVCSLSLVATLAPPASADELTWREEWPRFSAAEGVTTGVLGGGILAGLFVVKQQKDNWSGGILFDDAVRDGARIESRTTRDRWVFWGDLTFYGMVAYPFLDAGVTAWAVRGSPDVAGQLFSIDLQAMSMGGFVGVLSQKLVGRERPLVRECPKNPDYDKDCNDDIQRNQSFLSGHTAMSFTGAGLICVQHANLPLYGGGAADAIACGTGLGAAAFVATTRLVADRHYSSDVLSGAIIGGTAGFLLPAWWHFGLFDTGRGATRTQWMLTPYASADGAGLSLYGID